MPIIFFDDDAINILYPHDDALMVIMDIASHDMARTMVDIRSSVDIIFIDALQLMYIKSEKMLS